MTNHDQAGSETLPAVLAPVGLDALAVPEEYTLDYYVKARGPGDRKYVYTWAKARKCPHPRLIEMVTGDGLYRCEECNWTMVIVTGKGQPLHLRTVAAGHELLHFAKEHGYDALQEVLRTPHGQHERKQHTGVLPEGYSFDDAARSIAQVDVNTPDQGRKQLSQKLDEEWVSPKQRLRRAKEIAGRGWTPELEQAANLLLGIPTEEAAPDESSERKAVGPPSNNWGI